MSKFKYVTIACAFIVAPSGLVLAGGGGDHGHGHSPAAIGKPGMAGHVDRTIHVDMDDNSFSMDAIEVRMGETIRFKLVNRGDAAHEFSIGTGDMHAQHRKEMLKMMHDGKMDENGMPMAKDHDDENTLSLAPGDSGELIWTFTKAGKLEAACNLPGHYESGMHAKLAVLKQ